MKRMDYLRIRYQSDPSEMIVFIWVPLCNIIMNKRMCPVAVTILSTSTHPATDGMAVSEQETRRGN